VAYWSAREAAERGIAERFTGSFSEAVDELDRLLRDAVKLRMESDVPLGAFLSGGIDSSTVVALMQSQSSRPVRTFSIGFFEQGYNEADHAKAVARHLKTEHTELYLTPQDAMAVIPRLPAMYDEPFSDSSQIPTFLVSDLARRHVTVSLSGDGGDELFGGYPRYRASAWLWQRMAWMPAQVRRRVASSITALPLGLLNHGLGFMRGALDRYGSPGPVGEKLYKMAALLEHETPQALYTRLVSHWAEGSPALDPHESETPLNEPSQWARTSDFFEWMMFVDTVMYLPDDILAKVDRASMSVSLEARVPLLDHRVVELAWRIPREHRVGPGPGKWLLRRVLDRYVPRELIERPKMGFGVPIDSWLRGPLRDWAETLLDERKLRDSGLLCGPIRRAWADHLSGREDGQYGLWAVLMLRAWLDAQS
jgi:asparagine synthase (glutamine-hydrolysing)